MSNIRQVLSIIAAGIGVFVIVGMVILAVLARVVKAPATLGVRDGRLSPCPASPNCVSTFEQDERHGIASIPFTTSAAEARERLLRVLGSMARTRIITAEPAYIHVEFHIGGIMGYVDDVEFYFDEGAHVIHFRSASRLPYWDWGVNRERMEAVRRALETEGV